jgi:hypothetical protein
VAEVEVVEVQVKRLSIFPVLEEPAERVVKVYLSQIIFSR